MTSEYGINEARPILGDLVTEAQQGTEIVLTRHGRPIARIVPIEEPRMPTVAEWITTLRTFSVVPTVVDTLGIEDRSPGLTDLGRAQLAIEAHPFAELVTEIEAFFDGNLDEALAGPEAAEAEAEATRIIAGHIAKARTRLAVGAAILPKTDWTSVPADPMRLAHVALQLAADQRFIDVASPVVAE